MIAFKTAMIRLIRHPSSLMIGIIVTFVVALLTLIPAADEYSAIQERSEEVEFLVKQGTTDRDGLAAAQARFAEIQEELKNHHQRIIDDDSAHRVRETLVKFARSSKCHLRRVDVGPVRVRQWYEEDSPVQTVSTANRGKKTDFRLEVREMRLTLTGTMQQIESFLDKFETLDVQMHLQQLNLKALDANGDQIQLEVSLQLFGIRRPTKEEALKS
ncbi:hypothetical protein AB1L30_24380 [Bremerella sp. JC817]|uniref:hypothetical protein n=1 Tax=Bremerella sp. JC817 TaxID=3231756 RepID=UPI00345A63B2